MRTNEREAPYLRNRRQLERAVTERANHDTQPPFSKEEVALIRKAVLTPGAAVECPRCGSLLTIERPVASDGTGAVLWSVHCATCRRNLIVRHLTEAPPAD